MSPAPGAPARFPDLRAFLRFAPSPPRLGPALRAAIAAGVPLAIGLATGHAELAFLTTMGAFTALYASDRPYRDRALVLAGVALALAALPALGALTRGIPALATAYVAAAAMIVTYLCLALRIGPPGAYMMVLACAAGTHLPPGTFSPGLIFAVVLASAGFAWCVQMAGALVDPHGPERAQLRRAATVLGKLAGDPTSDRLRDEAGAALHETWSALVARQSARRAGDGELARLRGIGQRLQLIFARLQTPGAGIDSAEITVLAAGIGTPGERAGALPVSLPLGHPPAWESLRLGLKRGAAPRVVALRAFVAVLLAGLLGTLLDPERAYWAMAAAVLVLSAALDWQRSVMRGLARILGTCGGLGLSAALLAAHPGPAVILVIVVACQFLTEMLVIRHYALAVIFITCTAMIVSSGGGEIADPLGMLAARGAQTALGCAVSFLVYFIGLRHGHGPKPALALAGVLNAARALLPWLTPQGAANTGGRRARRDLQEALVTLSRVAGAGLYSVEAERAATRALWPAVMAAQRLGYALLAHGWTLETAPDGPPDGPAAITADPALPQALGRLAAGFERGGETTAPGALPEVFRTELATLSEALRTG